LGGRLDSDIGRHLSAVKPGETYRQRAQICTVAYRESPQIFIFAQYNTSKKNRKRTGSDKQQDDNYNCKLGERTHPSTLIINVWQLEQAGSQTTPIGGGQNF